MWYYYYYILSTESIFIARFLIAIESHVTQYWRRVDL
jgi:hypothetical protein